MSRSIPLRLRASRLLLRRAPHFDAAWYADQDHGITVEGTDPCFDYLVHGAREGRAPSAAFGSSQRHQAMAAAGVNPVLAETYGWIAKLLRQASPPPADPKRLRWSHWRYTPSARIGRDTGTALDLPARDAPSVAVVVPTYNSVRYLEERLDSILRQDWPIAELLILDDASTDGTVAEVLRLGQAWGRSFRLSVNERNSGSPSRQWLAAVGMLRSDLIWIAEADDVAHPHFLRVLVDLFRDPTLQLAYANTRIIDENGGILNPDTRDWFGPRKALWDRPFAMSGPDFLQNHLFERNVIPNASGVVFRRAALAKRLRSLEPQLGELRTAGDWLVYCELMREGTMAFVPLTMNACRRHSQSLSYNLSPQRHLAEIRRVQDYALNLIDHPADAVTRASAYARELAAELRIPDEPSPAVEALLP